jgi:glycosyltransferase involved in cell wall biosynthesis
MRGGEKCLEVFCELFPQAEIFTLFHQQGSVSNVIERMPIRTSFLQYLPGLNKHYRNYLPLFPRAVESFDLQGFDLVLSSSHCVAKGARPPQGAIHISYCYTPMRYAWLFFEEYFGQEPRIKKYLIRRFIRRLKGWDLKSNETIDFFVAISDNVKNRIRRFYGREAEVIYPPVDTERFRILQPKRDFYLVVSALVPYKRIELAIAAFNRLGRRLLIIGTGNCLEQLKRLARSNIEFLGWVSEAGLADYYAGCRALIFPGEEDFGITPLEAQACGRPVVAYAKGGALETVTENTGVFFYEQSPQALLEAVRVFETKEAGFQPQAIRKNALRFGRHIFKERIAGFIREKLNA